MRPYRELALDIMVNAIGGFVGAVVCFGIYIGVGHFGPIVETALSPVVAFGPVDKIYRDMDKACFALHITKLRAAVPKKYTFAVEAKLSEPIKVSAYLANDNNTKKAQEDLVTHPVGEKWVRHYCFELPGTIADWQELRVTGEAVHARHPFWMTRTPVPAFNIPGLNAIDDLKKPDR